MFDDVIEVYEKQEDISKIIEKIKSFSFSELKKAEHFYYSIDEKGTDVFLLEKNLGILRR